MATAMYTSGTTGKPKAIIFTHENIVSKRLCRGFALRGGRRGRRLPLLPAALPHLRALAGADRDALVGSHLRLRPLHRPGLAAGGLPRGEADGLHLRPQEVDGAPGGGGLGGGLRRSGRGGLAPARHHRRAAQYGLSAAGYLDPNVFRTFHRAGIELCSGYGMTEATGGITMTAAGPATSTARSACRCPASSAGGPTTASCSSAASTSRPATSTAARRRPARHEPDGWFHTGDLVSHGRRPLPHRRAQEGDLQEPRRPDHRAAAGGEPLPRLRGGGPGLPGRRSPRVQHAAGLAHLRAGPHPEGPPPRASCASSSPRWWPAPTGSWPPSSGWSPSRSCRGPSTSSTAS